MIKNDIISESCDALYALPPGAYHWAGRISDMINLILRKQLYDIDLWRLFVKQFSYNSDDIDNGWRGEFWGKMMRGACIIYAASGDDKLYYVLTDTVKELLGQQDELGRICTYSLEKEFHSWDVWSRKYVMLGLEYFYDICTDNILKEKIKKALMRHADYIIKKIGREAGKKSINETSDAWFGMNSSSILEPFVLLYGMTGEKRYLDFATYIVDEGGQSADNIFERAYEGKLFPYEYPATKAYEMMSCFEGLLEYYRATGTEKWKTAVLNFIDLVEKSEISVIGSAGFTHELFDHSAIKQFKKNESGIMQETCVTVTWMKLCYQALRLTGDEKYAAMLERSAFNAMSGAVNTEDCAENGGMIFDSYSPLYMQKRGCGIGGIRILELFRFYGCCAAIGAAGVGLSGVFPVMRSGDTIVFNTYIPGEITVTQNGRDIRLTIDTHYPAEGVVQIAVNEGCADIALRIPQFGKKTFLVHNGCTMSCKNGSYAYLSVRAGDSILLSIDCSLSVIYPQDCGLQDDVPKAYSMLAGPLVLARDARFHDGIEKECMPPLRIIRTDNRLFDNQITYRVICENNEYLVTDYASAGKTWTRASMLTVWIPAKTEDNKTESKT